MKLGETERERESGRDGSDKNIARMVHMTYLLLI